MPSTNKRIKLRPIVPVILAGGGGTRLWPVSRENYPKSLLKLNGNITLLQQILLQIEEIPHAVKPLIVGNVEYGSIIAEHVKEINTTATILLETESRNTAAAAAIAAQYAYLKAGNPLLLILPIDQAIKNFSEFSKMVIEAAKLANNEKLVIFGVDPKSPETGYGYIQKGAKLAKSKGYFVNHFKEKPDVKKASAYLKSGEYFWNSGIFLFLTSTFLEELVLHSPQIYMASKKVIKKIRNDSGGWIRLNTHLMKGCPSISVDEAILEKTKRAIVFPFKGDWHDLGTWDSLYKIAKKDKNGNATTKNVVSFATKNSYLYTTKQLLVTSGIDNLLVIVTKDAVLIACRDKTQDIKKIVNYLIWKKRIEATMSPIVYKSWGFYEVTDKTQGQEIKHFYVNPKNMLVEKAKSHSSTFWIIVEGAAQISIGKKIKSLSKNESIEIPKGKSFLLKNTSKVPLHFIEICNSSVPTKQ